MAFLTILFFFGLSAGTVSRIKGNSFWIWFLIGFCLPFFGTLAALFYRSEADEPLRRCPECGRILPISDQVCMRCGHDLAWTDEVVAP